MLQINQQHIYNMSTNTFLWSTTYVHTIHINYYIIHLFKKLVRLLTKRMKVNLYKSLFLHCIIVKNIYVNKAISFDAKTKWNHMQFHTLSPTRFENICGVFHEFYYSFCFIFSRMLFESVTKDVSRALVRLNRAIVIFT